jgi:hypothetical protein
MGEQIDMFGTTEQPKKLVIDIDELPKGITTKDVDKIVEGLPVEQLTKGRVMSEVRRLVFERDKQAYLNNIGGEG